MLELDRLSVSLPDGQILVGPVSLSAGPGQIVTIMGPSGIGKSTLLDAVGGHLAAGLRAGGDVRLDGRALLSLPAEARGVGLVAQDPALFPHLSVGQNLAFALPRSPARQAMIAETLTKAGLPGFETRDPATLSGGQRARVALIRSLLARPRALLLDEPFSRLDAALRAEMRAFTFDQLRAAGIPALLVTHDPADAEAAGGPILQLSSGSAEFPSHLIG